MTPPVLEICAETLAAVAAATRGAADCIELCSALPLDGLTPSDGLLRYALSQTHLPIRILIRPRAGDFVYSEAEIEVMRLDTLRAKDLGAAGVVVGLLTADGRVDIAGTRELVRLASPLPVTFHRAFDTCADPVAALEDVISTGADRLLTAGGSGTALQGAHVLAELFQRAAGRIDIMAGGGVRAGNVRQLTELTGLRYFHSSLASPVGSISEGQVRELARALSPGQI